MHRAVRRLLIDTNGFSNNSIIATQEPECTGCIRCEDGLLHILHDAYTGCMCVSSVVYAVIIHNYKQ